jgi:deoxyribodipyrimidine photo-lyase
MRIIHWFRRDLRVGDNIALANALKDSGGYVLPVFVLDDALLSQKYIAPIRVQFMLACLSALDVELRARGSRLIVRRGNPEAILAQLAREFGADAIYMNRDYTPAARARDARVSATLQAQGTRVTSFKDQVIYEESELQTGAGKPYTVFTPFKKAWLARLSVAPPASVEVGRFENGAIADVHAPAELPTMAQLGFNTTHAIPPAGEATARARLMEFRDSGALQAYSTQRDYPALDHATSHLSADLRFGTISVRECLRVARESIRYEWPQKKSLSPASTDARKDGGDAWISELIWREFYQQILFHFPHAQRGNFNRAYDTLTWGNGSRTRDEALFAAWKAGKTGYPIVDAAMRQLNATGWMHNRCRMIVASFLSKDLLLHWRWGERYFMRTLIDGDPAANNGGWQWASSTGTDAQPYFRIFNPRLQSERFDPEGVFIRRWLPELNGVPTDYIHAPHEMPSLIQAAARCVIGEDYPAPIVDHATQKEEALRRFKEVASKQ